MPTSTALVPLLDAPTRAEVQSLADAIEARDGEPPLSDQALTQLGSPDVVHVVAHDGDRLVGYAQLDGTTLELAGDAAAVAALLDTVEARGEADLRVWSHGRRSPVGAVLESRGYTQVRILHQLRRSLAEPLPEIAVADGVTIRAFVPGQDEQAWLRVNAAAFATHAEQGRWTLADHCGARSRAVVRPGRLLPGRARREVARLSLDEDPCRRHRRGLRPRHRPVGPGPQARAGAARARPGLPRRARLRRGAALRRRRQRRRDGSLRTAAVPQPRLRQPVAAQRTAPRRSRGPGTACAGCCRRHVRPGAGGCARGTSPRVSRRTWRVGSCW